MVKMNLSDPETIVFLKLFGDECNLRVMWDTLPRERADIKSLSSGSTFKGCNCYGINGYFIEQVCDSSSHTARKGWLIVT